MPRDDCQQLEYCSGCSQLTNRVERTNLIRGIKDVKVPTGLVETLGRIRLWRRSVGKSEELRVTVDLLVLLAS